MLFKLNNLIYLNFIDFKVIFQLFKYNILFNNFILNNIF